MTILHLLRTPPAWWAELARLDGALEARAVDEATRAYARVVSELAEEGSADLAAAAARMVLASATPFSRAAMRGDVPAGLRAAFERDLAALQAVARRDWADELSRLRGAPAPALEELAPPPEGADRAIADALGEEEPASLRERLERHFRRHGDGLLSRHLAFRWTRGALAAIAHPSMPRMERLVGLQRQLDLLTGNTEAFLEGQAAHHALMYGPRGSGKSTAIRALLPRYHARGLRIVEIAADDLDDLPAVLEALRGRPHRYLLFVDDLSFDAGDPNYRPLKTLLEGSLTAPPGNALVYATSNRRHLVQERFSDRPDPLDDDVHAWDTHQERLALADRFGLTITFPDATQRRYLEIVRGLVADRGIEAGAELEEQAIRFAEWGNGYSGRTAEQFVRALRHRTSPDRTPRG